MRAAPDALAKARRAADIAKALYLHNPRVSLIDVGEKREGGERTGRLAVRIHVTRKPIDQPLGELQAQLGADFIDTDRIPFETDIIEAIYAMHEAWPMAQTSQRAGTANPLVGGVSISSEYLWGYGTLGCVVTDRVSGDPMVLSNWHVLVAMLFPSSLMGVVQPGLGDGGWGQRIGAVVRHGIYRGHDAAVAVLDGGRHWSDELLDLGSIRSARSPILGETLTKSGRGSGVTTGIVEGIEGAYPMRYTGGMLEIRDIMHLGSAEGSEVSTGGDSGSVWCDPDTIDGVGLHFAGSNSPEFALAMALPPVLDELNVRLPG